MRENTQNNILFGLMLEGDIQNRGRYENGKADTFLYYMYPHMNTGKEADT
jgi:hypothetical protein